MNKLREVQRRFHSGKCVGRKKKHLSFSLSNDLLLQILAGNCSQRLLYQKGFLSPLQKLLSICESDCPEELERRLVALLNTLCVTLSQNADLLQIFFQLVIYT